MADYFPTPQEKCYILANFQSYRIIQPRVVFIHGLPQDLSFTEALSSELLQFGSISKLTLQTISKDFYSAFCEFEAQISAALAILTLNGRPIKNRTLRVFYGSTKFCPNFLKTRPCLMNNCNYAHYYHPYLIHLKVNVKHINHEEIANLQIMQFKEQIPYYLPHMEHYHARHKSQFPWGLEVLQLVFEKYAYFPMRCYQQEINEKDITIPVSAQAGTERADEKDKHFIEYYPNDSSTICSSQYIDEWEGIEKEICEYEHKISNSDRKMTKIQLFLQETDKILMQLIFRFEECSF